MQRKHFIKPDDKCNPELKDQLGTVRGGMMGAAESVIIPDRFECFPREDDPSIDIIDTLTGRKTNISLCHYRGVREALRDLFHD